MTNNISKLYVLLIITVISIFSLKDIKFGKQSSADNIISVKFEFYGMDASTIETIITTPLEKELFQMGNIKEINSISQSDEVIFIIQFHKETDYESNYLQTRNIVYDFYTTLPSSVQKPQLYTSNITKESSICFCIHSDKEFAESILKPELLKIDGVAQVQFTGTGTPCIKIQYDTDKLKKYNIDQALISESLNSSNHQNISLSLSQNDNISFLNFPNSLNTIDKIENIPILSNHHNLKLSDIAKVEYTYKENDHKILLNNNVMTAVNITATADNKLINISRTLNRILKQKQFSKFDPIIIYDSGYNQLKQISRSIYSFISTSLLISLFIILSYKSVSICIKVILTVMTSLLWTLGTLTICRINISSEILCGITLSIGLIVDMPLTVLNLSNRSQSKKLISALITASVTTILSLTPLILSADNFPELKSISISISLMVTYSTLISVYYIRSTTLLPKIEQPIFNVIINKITKRKINNRFIRIFFYICGIFGLLLFIFLDYEQQQETNTSIITTNIEFNPEKQASHIEKELVKVSSDFAKLKNLKYFKTESTRGNGKIDFIFNKQPSIKTKQLIKDKLTQLQNASIYIPSTRGNNNFNLKLAVTGPDYIKCQEYCKIIAQNLSAHSIVNQAILNFKNPEKSFQIIPEKNKAAHYKISSYEISTHLRWLIYKPVISKYLLHNKETDIQLESSAPTSLDNIENIQYENKLNSKDLSAVAEIVQKYSPQRIHHLNGKPCAYITLELSSLTEQVLSALKKELHKMKLPIEYQVKFDKEILIHKKNIMTLKIFSLLAILIIFLYLFSVNENIKLSIFISFSIMVVYTFPELLMLILNKKMTYGILTGLFILAGTSVNNLIYISNGHNSHINTILISSLTTIISAILNLILPNNSFTKDISFIIFTGTIFSVFITINRER